MTKPVQGVSVCANLRHNLHDRPTLGINRVGQA
jgi:hypothetical protein